MGGVPVSDGLISVGLLGSLNGTDLFPGGIYLIFSSLHMSDFKGVALLHVDT